MLLAQGRYWRSGFSRGSGVVGLELRRAALPEDLYEHKERVGAAIGSDRLLAELRRVILDATAVAVEEGVLVLSPPGGEDP